MIVWVNRVYYKCELCPCAAAHTNTPSHRAALERRSKNQRQTKFKRWQACTWCYRTRKKNSIPNCGETTRTAQNSHFALSRNGSAIVAVSQERIVTNLCCSLIIRLSHFSCGWLTSILGIIIIVLQWHFSMFRNYFHNSHCAWSESHNRLICRHSSFSFVSTHSNG